MSSEKMSHTSCHTVEAPRPRSHRAVNGSRKANILAFCCPRPVQSQWHHTNSKKARILKTLSILCLSEYFIPLLRVITEVNTEKPCQCYRPQTHRLLKFAVCTYNSWKSLSHPLLSFCSLASPRLLSGHVT